MIMKFDSYKKLCLFFFTILFLLTGCNSPVYYQAEANIADVAVRAKEARHASNCSGLNAPSLIVNRGVYVDKRPISLYSQPSWLNNHIIIRGDQLPFSYYSRTIASGGGPRVLTHYQVEMDQGQLISMNYSGTVRGALNLLASKTGNVFTIRGNQVYWQAFITKTFDVAFMPGSSDYLVGRASGAGKGNVGGASASGPGGGVTVTGFIDDSSSAQYSSLKGSLSVWDDLRSTIAQMLSRDGRVLVSEATTTVTVRDRPTNVALITQFIKNLNCKLSKQVLVKVQVLEVQLNNNFSYGINWNILQHAFDHSNYILNANFGTPITFTPLTVPAIPTYGLAADPNLQSGQSVIQSLVHALSEQGKVSIVSEPRVVCLNNQVSVIRIVQQKGYLASLQTTNFGGGTSSGSTASTSVTTQLTPGTVVYGVTLYILPKIMEQNIFMQVNADLSNLIKIDPVSSTGNGDATAGSDAPIIQVPNLTQKQFNQRSMLKNGETLILSGFRQLQNQTGASQLATSQDLGGKAALQLSTETIILITPIILHGPTV